MWVDLHGYSGWTGWQVKYVRSPPTYKLHTHLLLYPHCSDWPGLNCWMHPKEEGSPSGTADNECPLSILESESHRETGRRRERERSYTVLSFTCEAAPLTVFLLFCSISISPKSPPPPHLLSLFLAYPHTFTYGLNSLTVCCTGPDIYPYTETLTFKAHAAHHLHQACSRGMGHRGNREWQESPSPMIDRY